jgi:hypothetical protein
MRATDTLIGNRQTEQRNVLSHKIRLWFLQIQCDPDVVQQREPLREVAEADHRGRGSSAGDNGRRQVRQSFFLL